VKKGELVGHLEGWDDELEVKIRIADPDGLLEEEESDGVLLDIAGETSLLVEGGVLTIIGDVPPE